MKFIDEYRDQSAAKKLAEKIRAVTKHPWTLMEVCGGQTHAIVKFGLDELLPPALNLIHGPGCPVCVTPLEQIDKALDIAGRPEVIFCSFGDMLRVPEVFLLEKIWHPAKTLLYLEIILLLQVKIRWYLELIVILLPITPL